MTKRENLDSRRTVNVLHSPSITSAGDHLEFGALGTAVLRTVAEIADLPLPNDIVRTLKEAMSTLPAHADVLEALTRLREAEVRLVTLTKGAVEAQRRPFNNAGVAHLDGPSPARGLDKEFRGGRGFVNTGGMP